jgi:hypothetical protein
MYKSVFHVEVLLPKDLVGAIFVCPRRRKGKQEDAMYKSVFHVKVLLGKDLEPFLFAHASHEEAGGCVRGYE